MLSTPGLAPLASALVRPILALASHPWQLCRMLALYAILGNCVNQARSKYQVPLSYKGLIRNGLTAYDPVSVHG